VDRSDADRLKLLDRIAERLPELRLDQHEIAWTTLDDGSEALLVDGAGFDGGTGSFFANAGDDLHAVGSLDPIVPGCVGCIVIRPDGSRYLAKVMADPLAQREANQGVRVLSRKRREGKYSRDARAREKPPL
jgi:hypothetical protein